MFVYLLLIIIIVLCIYCYLLINRNNEIINGFLYVREASNPQLGRGVFTRKYIFKGEIIEKAPFIIQNHDEFQGNILNYLFTYNAENRESAIGFGYSSLYNHSDNNNAQWTIDENYITIVATKDINIGEEIFISYGEPYWDARADSKI